MSYPVPLPALAPLIGALDRSRDPCRTAFDALPRLLKSAGWLPASLLAPDPAGYRRELLYQPPDDRYSIGCFVWAPGQKSPIHDHSCWCALGVVRGQLRERSFVLSPSGTLIPTDTLFLARGSRIKSRPGEDDIHEVAGSSDSVSISIHIYGSPFDRVCRTLYEGGAA